MEGHISICLWAMFYIMNPCFLAPMQKSRYALLSVEQRYFSLLSFLFCFSEHVKRCRLLDYRFWLFLKFWWQFFLGGCMSMLLFSLFKSQSPFFFWNSEPSFWCWMHLEREWVSACSLGVSQVEISSVHITAWRSMGKCNIFKGSKCNISRVKEEGVLFSSILYTMYFQPFSLNTSIFSINIYLYFS